MVYVKNIDYSFGVMPLKYCLIFIYMMEMFS